MMARKKTIETIKATDFSVDSSPRLKLLKVSLPPARKEGIKVNSISDLLKKLNDKEGIKL